MDFFTHSLDNGIRLIHTRVPGLVAHCGLMIDAGSRNETAKEHGIAHFIEHMLFKGTKKRKAYHILSRLEDVGGELNAYTTKEETVIHASFLKEDFERATELISDLVFNSVFPGKEIEKEKDVVLDEINSYLDNPSELIFDDFEELVFKDLPIGRNILGSPSSVKNFTKEKIRAFMKANYDPAKMVFCSVGNIPDEKVLRYFLKYFSVPVTGGKVKQKETEWNYKPAYLEKNRDTYQNHCITGNLAYDLKDSRRVGMFLLNNILGGPGLNSRLNLSLREKNGLAYNIESNYNPYTGTGIFMIYFGTDAKLLKKSLDITMSELKKLRTEKLGAIQMSKARNQMKGYLARGYENYESLMLSLGKNLLVFGRMETFGETCKKIDAVTPSDLMEFANDIFEPSMMSTLIYK